MQQLNGRVAVVTGGASGIGRGLVNRFAAEGMKVVIADVEKDPLDQAVAEVRATGAEAIGVVTDVSDRAAVENLAAATMDAFGAVHVLCNNAGVETGGAFQDVPLAGWRWVMDVNVFGVVHGCQVFLPLLRRQSEGHIVNTASVAAFELGIPTMAPYAASKSAVLGLSESLALELRAAGTPVGVASGAGCRTDPDHRRGAEPTRRRSAVGA
jgi:NAD(P)-dependent dehydrogenase (short-subunit alcohol dehydrogenase family)